MPDEADVGAATVAVTATDLTGDATTVAFDLTVSTTSDGPTATLTAIPSASEEATFTYDAASHFYDAEPGNALSFSCAGPNWLTVDASTGLLSGTPTNDDIGLASVTVTVTDQTGQSASTSLELSVDNVNNVPLVTDIFDPTSPEDEIFSYDTASHFRDMERDGGMTYAVSGPAWLTIDSASGLLSGLPSQDDIGPTLLTVTATNRSGACVSADFHLAVSLVDGAPTVSAIESLDPSDDAPFSYDASVHFGNVDSGDILTFSVNGPDWLSIDDVSGEITGTPANAHIGPTLVTVTATDLFGDSTSVDFHVVVANIKDAPTVTTIEDLTSAENAPFSYDASDHFADGGTDDTLVFSVRGPDWLTIDAQTGVLSGMPTTDDLGRGPVTVTATSSKGATASSTFDLLVEDVDAVKVSGYGSAIATTEGNNLVGGSEEAATCDKVDDNYFLFREGDGNDHFSGGAGPDTILLRGADGDVPKPDTYTLNLSNGTAELNGDQFDLSANAAGTLTFEDGSSVSFDGVETISWANNPTQKANTEAGADGTSEKAADAHVEDLLTGGARTDTTSGEPSKDTTDESPSAEQDGDAAKNAGSTVSDYLFGDIGDHLVSGDGDKEIAEDETADTFVIIEGKSSDTISGITSRTDVIHICGSSGSGAPSQAWSVSVDGGEAQTITSDQGFLNLGSNRSGRITFDDGTEVSFEGIERIEW